MSAERRRLPEVKTLYEILPKGTEGGKEFARIVDLLLFHEARRSSKKITIFSDVAGDYYGLDSFGTFRKYGKTGYQYKFYPSPLSPDHRREIERSLKKVAENQENLKIKKWILITPEDFMETSRKERGDVTWFERLPEKLNLRFEIEHWGHRNLLSLFLETPSLCLYYYPELVPDGFTHKKTIQDTRKRYNDNLNTLYGTIEFVGMSVYKEEAKRGVPMEDIYIPLTVIPEGADETDPHVTRKNPLSFLEPSARHVILGDPGSGKSTLLKFLALVGTSEPLQKRYNAKLDERLPILIELRRYADELKSRKTLSLIDYIREVIQGDFNLKSADLDFFEYYLETDQAILLFDGLDELPNPQYKRIVRDRIRTLITTYPGNTTVVTSRIIGYGSPFRFDEEEFSHYKLTRLQLPEIEQFVRDWYAILIKSECEQEEHINDLISIFQDEDHISIRELAENPLLLTIIVLVHRIDAVLPDERVVLYQKFTETLLDTWYIWKFRTEETEKREHVERWNRRRIEEIAYWMHCQGLVIDRVFRSLMGQKELKRFLIDYIAERKSRRAIVNHKKLKRFLTDYIAQNEKVHDQGSDPGVLAERFLDFVRERAGLLVEVGDNQYSFIHLTFQEYLASSCILTRGEKYGVSSTWETIEGYCDDPRWHEVIRLLIAGYKLYDCQEFLVKKILEKAEQSKDVMYSLLLSGLLLDKIEAAKRYQKRILCYLFLSASKADNIEELRLILERLRIWIGKQDKNEEVASEVFRSLWEDVGKSLWKRFSNKEKMALLLIASSLNWSESKINELTGNFFDIKSENAELYGFFLCELSDLVPSPFLRKKLELFWVVKDYFSLKSPFTSFVAAASQAVISSLKPSLIARRAFEELFLVLSFGLLYDYAFDYVLNSLQLFFGGPSPIHEWVMTRTWNWDLNKKMDMAKAMARVMEATWTKDMVRFLRINPDLDVAGPLGGFRNSIVVEDPVGEDLRFGRALAVCQALSRAKTWARAAGWVRTFYRPAGWVEASDRDADWDVAQSLDKRQNSGVGIWQSILTAPKFYSFILDFLCSTFALKPYPQWWEALRVRFLPTVQKRVTFFNEVKWKQVETIFEREEAGETEIYTASWLLLFDAWLYTYEYCLSKDESTFTHLADITRETNAPSLRIAHCIRDLAYGDESRTEDLVAMVKSDDPEYREIFEVTYWRPKSK